MESWALQGGSCSIQHLQAYRPDELFFFFKSEKQKNHNQKQQQTTTKPNKTNPKPWAGKSGNPRVSGKEKNQVVSSKIKRLNSALIRNNVTGFFFFLKHLFPVKVQANTLLALVKWRDKLCSHGLWRYICSYWKTLSCNLQQLGLNLPLPETLWSVFKWGCQGFSLGSSEATSPLQRTGKYCMGRQRNSKIHTPGARLGSLPGRRVTLLHKGWELLPATAVMLMRR